MLFKSNNAMNSKTFEMFPCIAVSFLTHPTQFSVSLPDDNIRKPEVLGDFWGYKMEHWVEVS